MLNKLFSWLKLGAASSKTDKVIVARRDHCISRTNINPNAIKVLYRLKKAGFAAYLVGGGVRDLLLKHLPKDFDIATDAKPEEVRKLFRNCRLIGRRFRLAHIYFGRDIIEVATFRGNHTSGVPYAQTSKEGQLLRDNVYGTLEQDVVRRDFTVNALYYNIRDFSVVDYVGGLQDLQTKTLRLIGRAQTRYKEDPVRMLRAVRFAAKLKFSIEATTAEPIFKMAHLLARVPTARLFEEFIKLFLTGNSAITLPLLQEYGLFAYLLPQLDAILPENKQAQQFVQAALRDTDKRLKKHKTVNPAFLFACMLWYPFLHKLRTEKGANPHVVASGVLSQQRQSIAVPKRVSIDVKEIWMLQKRLEKITNKNVDIVLGSKKIRAAYDFFILRQDVKNKSSLKWWQQYMTTTKEQQDAMLARLLSGGRKRNNKNG